MNILAAAYKGMELGAKEVAQKQGTKFNGKYNCVACKDDAKNCDTCPRGDGD